MCEPESTPAVSSGRVRHSMDSKKLCVRSIYSRDNYWIFTQAPAQHTSLIPNRESSWISHFHHRESAIVCNSEEKQFLTIRETVGEDSRPPQHSWIRTRSRSNPLTEELWIKIITDIWISNVVCWSYSIKRSTIETRQQHEILVIVMILIKISSSHGCVLLLSLSSFTHVRALILNRQSAHKIRINNESFWVYFPTYLERDYIVQDFHLLHAHHLISIHE